MTVQVLAADVGGTKVAIGSFAVDADGALTSGEERRYPSADFARGGEVVARFCRDVGRDARRFDAVCFAVAGPVRDGRAQPPHLGWYVDAAELAADAGCARVRVVNDLYGTAAGLGVVGADQRVTVAAGDPDPAGTRAVVAPGTGLGMAAIPRGDGPNDAPGAPLATEGGHATYAAQTEQEWRLHRSLSERYGHVSQERVVSGQGIANIHAFLLADAPSLGDPAVAAAVADAPDPAAAITAAALDRRCPRCVATLRLFARALGAAAGNFALSTLATGGVYVAGGVPPRVLPFLQEPGFLEAFRAKGRFRPLLEQIPVHVVLEPRTALLGAATLAARMART